jgi:hypothetical protein
VPVEHTYDYAIIRIVPRVDRGECLNAGIVLSCPHLEFLQACVVFDAARVSALDSSADLEAIEGHLHSIVRICQGGPDAGAVGELPQRARFHWLVSPRSTVIQMSPVHTGRTSDPAAALARLVETMVRVGPRQP